MCLALRMNFSRKTSGTPNAVPASRRAWSMASSSGSADSTTPHPRPPPPIDAFTITGYPSASATVERLGARHNRLRTSREDRNTRRRRDRTRGHLVAKQVEQLGAGPTNVNPGGDAGAGELGVLREKPVARMNRVDPLLLGERDDRRDVQVASDRLAGVTDQVRLVGLEPVHRESVFVRIDRDGSDAQLVCRAKDADGDFATVGDEQFADWGHLLKARSLQNEASLNHFAMRQHSRAHHDCRKAALSRFHNRAGQNSATIRNDNRFSGTRASPELCQFGCFSGSDRGE